MIHDITYEIPKLIIELKEFKNLAALLTTPNLPSSYSMIIQTSGSKSDAHRRDFQHHRPGTRPQQSRQTMPPNRNVREGRLDRGQTPSPSYA